MAKKALVTGASSGIGKEISRTLIDCGYSVYGIGRTFDSDFDSNSMFHPINLDLLSPMLEKSIKELTGTHDFDLLVNNAGVGYYGLHEELNADKIKTMVRTNLETPMIITNIMLRDLKNNNGRIINVASVTAVESNPHGAAYGATKAGLLSFASSLFDEARKYGVKVTTILPDMTDTKLYRNADFTVSDDRMAYLNPKDIADCVRFVIECPDNQVISELTVKPQLKKIQRKKI
ncbi:MAG: SDR family NAD(P)-dependent oxidoreductase [Clostridia bacterium]|nr:SDR family NAD(P)-dependent oxidoreductase [Clostridia bacterium]